MYLVTADEMREMDRRTIEEFGIPGIVLMENAGRGAVEFLFREFPGVSGMKVGVAAGRGNNGGDGHVIARYLKEKGTDVIVFLLSEKSAVKGDAAINLKLLEPLGIPVIEVPDEKALERHRVSMAHREFWVDAMLGTGLSSDVRGIYADMIHMVLDWKRPVFSVDIPSGLNSDTGKPNGISIKADATATFAYPKIGHFLHPGPKYTGKLHVVDIGIPEMTARGVNPRCRVITPEIVKRGFVPRDPEAHKGTTGHLLVAAGSTGKTGAAAMTALSAMRVGAGLVTLGVPESLHSVLESTLLEVMTLPLPERSGGMLGETAYDSIVRQLEGKRCLALGPGLGTSRETASLVKRILRTCQVPMVIDADGLNNLARDTSVLKKTETPIILTPHPGEMARLSGMTTKEVMADRIYLASEFAREFGVYLVLKGACTLVAHPDGKVYVNVTGNPGMASGGMGDVLTGIIAGLVTQGYDPGMAAHMGVYLHGAASDRLALEKGPVGFLAGDVMNAIPGEIKKIVNDKQLNI